MSKEVAKSAGSKSALVQKEPERGLRSVAEPDLQSPSEQLLRLHGKAGNSAVSRLLGSGRPLADAVREDMETRFGTDFRHVRIHDSPRAHRSASLFQAQAYTFGHDIVFNSARFVPNTHEGKRLLAHELAHVVQQSRGGPEHHSVSMALEQRAEQAASMVVGGHGPVQVQGASGAGLARQVMVEFGPNETNELIQFWEDRIKREPSANKRATYQRYIQTLQSGGRPTGRQAEEEMRYFYRQIGPAAEKAYKLGSEVPLSGKQSKGSTKPDIPLSVADMEIKARDITNPKNAANIIAKIRAQTAARREGGRAYVSQHPVILDLRGQKVTQRQIDRFVDNLSKGAQIPKDQVQVIVNAGWLSTTTQPFLSTPPPASSQPPATDAAALSQSKAQASSPGVKPSTPSKSQLTPPAAQTAPPPKALIQSTTDPTGTAGKTIPGPPVEPGLAIPSSKARSTTQSPTGERMMGSKPPFSTPWGRTSSRGTVPKNIVRPRGKGGWADLGEMLGSSLDRVNEWGIRNRTTEEVAKLTPQIKAYQEAHPGEGVLIAVQIETWDPNWRPPDVRPTRKFISIIPQYGGRTEEEARNRWATEPKLLQGSPKGSTMGTDFIWVPPGQYVPLSKTNFINGRYLSISDPSRMLIFQFNDDGSFHGEAVNRNTFTLLKVEISKPWRITLDGNSIQMTAHFYDPISQSTYESEFYVLDTEWIQEHRTTPMGRETLLWHKTHEFDNRLK